MDSITLNLVFISGVVIGILISTVTIVFIKGE